MIETNENSSLQELETYLFMAFSLSEICRKRGEERLRLAEKNFEIYNSWVKETKRIKKLIKAVQKKEKRSWLQKFRGAMKP